MADAGHTPEDKEQQDSAPKDEAAQAAGQPAAEPDTEKGVTTGFAEAPEAAPKLVAPESAPSSPAAVPAAAHSHDAHDHSHDAHGHSHDAHSHSHDTPAHDAHAHDDAHPVATDIIPENSLQDQLLSGLAMAVLCAFVLLVVTWYCAFPTTPVAAEHNEASPPGSVEQH